MQACPRPPELHRTSEYHTQRLDTDDQSPRRQEGVSMCPGPLGHSARHRSILCAKLRHILGP